MRYELLAETGAPNACRNCMSSQRQSQVGWPAVVLHHGIPGVPDNPSCSRRLDFARTASRAEFDSYCVPG